MNLPVFDDIARSVLEPEPAGAVFPTPRGEAGMMNTLFSRMTIHDEPGVIQARHQARTIAEHLNFPARDRLAICSAVTRAVAESLRCAGGCLVEFRLEGEATPSLVIQVADSSSRGSEATTNRPRNLEPASDWMDRFELQDQDGQGMMALMARDVPDPSLSVDASLVAKVADELLGLQEGSPINELLDEDLALFRSIHESQTQKRELIRLNTELEQSRKAILALHVELSERVDWQKTANDLKTWFLSRVSHELRTPLASILGLARLLLNRSNGELATEQERQVSFILRAANDLSGLINDLLDLARLEARREKLRLGTVHIPDFFDTLRGMFRPLVPPSSPVVVVFEDPGNLPPLWTDEAKLTQVLRNFLSNALKFTQSGEIRVKAEAGAGDTVIFSVIDTGLGISPEELEKVFDEFSQGENSDHHCSQGMGLGLPLARKLAAALGGRVDVRSEPGVGSTFSATIPIRFDETSPPFGGEILIP